MTAIYVRRCEAAKRAKGLREIRVWVPDTPEAIAAVRAVARNLIEETDAQQSSPQA